MEIKILDNRKYGNVVDSIRGDILPDSQISIISAFFTIFAYKELQIELNKIHKLRFLFTEPSFKDNSIEIHREFNINGDIKENIFGNKYEIKFKNKLTQAHIAKECAEWIKTNVEIKAIKEKNMAENRMLYIENNIDDVAVTGTLDLTADGLGIISSDRLDLNTYIKGKEYTKEYLNIFNEIWEDDNLVQDIKDEILKYLEIVYIENTPEFIYFVTLYNIFKDYLDELTEDNIIKSETGIKDTVIWNKLYKFQKDGALGIINKLEKYQGCILADSVGLGKTYTAIAVIKYYELRNDRVLVLVPKKLRDNWAIYTKNDKRNILIYDRLNYDILNHTDLSRYNGYSGDINLETVNWSNYDLVVIDESHNFRNDNSTANKETRYSRLMNEVIKKGVKTKVLMLSATPVNNRMNDLKNQVAFITEGHDLAFKKEGINSIESTLKNAQQTFNRWSKLEDEKRNLDSFIEMINMDYFKLLDTATIARSRKHIERYYNINEIGKFPKRLKPKNIKSLIDIDGKFPSLEEVNKIIRNLNFSAYTPLKYLLLSKREEYSEKYDIKVKGGQSIFRQTDREQSLIGLMRVGLLKRMESSINSFGMTIAKLLNKIDYLIKEIEKDNIEYGEEVSILGIHLDDEDFDEFLIGNKVKVLLRDIDRIRWKQDLEEDRAKLENLLIEAAKVTNNRDAKLNDLKGAIKSKLDNPLNIDNKKIIIFTAFADTANYLYENLKDWIKEQFNINAALVTGTGSNKTTMRGVTTKDINSILTNFSPRSKEREKTNGITEEEIDILIATDCISEGQNLQDCDYLINYDIHWNPVRIIQRFGRIDRIGSICNSIQLVNFWPNMELDEYINLESRVKGRMVLLDVSATGEENIIDQDEDKEMNDLEYRRKQLKQLQEEVMDLEEIAGGISITDLTMNDFKMDLMEYLKLNQEKLENAPLGMYALAPTEGDLKDQIKPGVIFTLKQIKVDNKPEEYNSLYPYYLVYIYDDGTVKYNYTHTKKILDIYKKIANGQDKVFEDLVEIFNKSTKDGMDMEKYTNLLQQSITNIVGKKEEKGLSSLFRKGGTSLQKTNFDGIEGFELVSFLIIKQVKI